MPATPRPEPTVSLRLPVLLLLAVSALLAAWPALALGGRQAARLEQAQTAFASAVRWSDYEAALQLVDPAWRTAHPMSGLQLERYRQLQVSSYREGGNTVMADGSVVREVEVGAVNRHTQAERVVRWREQWRWDEEAGRWWQVSGLPDFWDGQ